MPDLNIIRQMINPSALIPLIITYARTASVILTEPQEHSCSVTISGIPTNAVVIRADNFQSPNTFLTNANGQCRRADFVIVSDDHRGQNIVYIEMKKNKSPENDVIQQLTGAKCLVSYLKAIGQEFWEAHNFLDGYQHRFVSLAHLPIPKHRTRMQPPKKIPPLTGIHDRPDNMLKIIYPANLRFDRLIQ